MKDLLKALLRALDPFLPSMDTCRKCYKFYCGFMLFLRDIVILINVCHWYLVLTQGSGLAG